MQQVFPSVEQLLDIIFAELPQGVYATDRADDANLDKRSYSSSELRAHAQLFANIYENLQNINSDKFISTVTLDGLSQWEYELFSSAADSMHNYIYRQQRLLSKIRASGGINLPAISSIISGILTPVGLTFAILPWSGQYNIVANMYGTWRLDLSELDIDTFLGTIDPLVGASREPGIVPLDCAHNYTAAGITQAQMIEIQQAAYTYEVDIYGNADANTLALLDQQLTAFEPARSTHIIVNNAVAGPPL